jgi:Spy/CpxP family protein refolding chaperone
MSSPLKPWLLLAVIFIVGVVTGSALTIGLASHFRYSPGVQQIKRLWMARLVTRLNLTSDQQAKIEPILADAATDLQKMHRNEVERGSQIMKTADDRIAALLTPEQKVELQKMESDREKRFSDHMRPWGTPHDGQGVMHHHGGPPGDHVAPAPPPDAATNAAPPGA